MTYLQLLSKRGGWLRRLIYAAGLTICNPGIAEQYRFLMGAHPSGSTNPAYCAAQPWFSSREAACQATAAGQSACDRSSATYRSHVATLLDPATCRLAFEFQDTGATEWHTFSYVSGIEICGAGYVLWQGKCAVLDEQIRGMAPASKLTDPCGGNPIYPLTGIKREFVDTGVGVGGFPLVLTYDSGIKLASTAPSLAALNAFGALWNSNYHRKLSVAPEQRGATVPLGDGSVLSFTGNGFGSYAVVGSVSHRLAGVSGGGFRFENVLKGSVETFDASGKLTSIAQADGRVLNFIYTGENLTSVQANDGRQLSFSYTNELITTITAPDGQTTGASYDSNGNLTSLSWSDTKAVGFIYENTNHPWALTGRVDENGQRYSTFAYDSAGRAISSQHAGGIDGVSVSYGTPAHWIVVDSYDAANNILHRVHSWQAPSGTTFTNSNGQAVSMDAEIVSGRPALVTQSQPAGSGCAAAIRGISYDSSGNIASQDDFNGGRICYAYDASNREAVRVEGLTNSAVCSAVLPSGSTLPMGARKITTIWHSDWNLPTAIEEPRRKTMLIYHGQSDPMSNNAIASCTTTANRTDGRPVPMLCKKTEQALLPNGSVDTSVAARTEGYAYDSVGRVLTSTDVRGQVTSHAYYGDTDLGGDGQFGSVSLLLHADAADGTTAILDVSPTSKTFTASGGARVRTAQQKFGGSAMYFGADGDRFTTPPHDDFRWGTGDFTVEAWIYVTAFGPGGHIAGMHRAYTDALWLVSTTSDGRIVYYHNYANNRTSTATLPTNSWQHVAVSRMGGVNRMFINGVLDSTWTDTVNYSGYGYGLTIGGDYTGHGGAQFHGYIDELRITKGVARYTATFTPAAQAFAQTPPTPSGLGHLQGDLHTSINAAGHLVRYTQYDQAGRVRQMIDPNGITWDFTYTPRGWLSTVSATPSGGGSSTTSQTYDGVGQLTRSTFPDGSYVGYEYDAAHRLKAVTDNLGNRVDYTLDNSGNRIGEEVRDPGGALRRQLSRSIDALNRVQQVTGTGGVQ